MTDRRSFLSAIAGAGSALWLRIGPGGSSAPRVTATPTIFFAPPDGRNTLVRFVVEASDAPAGRLRVFDRARRQLGTAGVIGVSGRLYGELWLSLDRETDITTELEIRGAQGIIRTTHRLVPRRKWTVHWMPAANGLAPRAAEAEFLDHLEFLELGAKAPPGAVIMDDTQLLDRVATASMMLAGSGIRWVGRSDAREPVTRIESRDGSSVLAVPVTGAGRGLGAGRNEMARGIENWLDGPGALIADEKRSVALIVGAAEEESEVTARIADWNSRFVYPRLVTGQSRELLELAEERAVRVDRPARAPAAARWERRMADTAQRSARAFEPLVSRLPDRAGGLGALAAQFAFTTPGTLVLNPTPFSSSGIAVMPDGSERMVSEVPAFGYLCVPYSGRVAPAHPAGAGWWTPVPGSDNDLTLDARHFQVRIDLESGAIRSLVSRANGREWVRRGGLVNSSEGSRLDSLQKLVNAGSGLRIVVGRRLATGGTLTTSVTIYEDLPWVDIINRQAGGTGGEPHAYGFSFGLDQPDVSWEVPGGFELRAAPVERLAHLRWLRLSAGSDTVLIRGLDSPLASVAADSRIESLAPAEARYRIGVSSGFSAPEDPWSFGWGAESLQTVPVPGTGRARLTSFGSLLVMDQSGACILEVRRDPDGDGVMTYVQELTGRARDITLGPGVLSFKGARRIDFAGRHVSELPLLAGGGVAVPLRPYGITAVRLTGVELAAG